MLNWDDPLAKPKLQESTPAPAVKETAPAHPHVVEEAARQIQVEQQAEPEVTTMEPINPEDKRVINGLTDINQLAPSPGPGSTSSTPTKTTGPRWTSTWPRTSTTTSTS
jgi:ribonucleoside-diphosphate reductase beta chain